MKILRSVLAVLVGYFTFGLSAFLLFQLSSVDPHANPSTMFAVFSIAFGIVFSALGGLLTQLISRTSNLTINFVLAGIIAGFAAISWFMTEGNHYSQIAAIFLFAPCSILGGLMYIRRSQKI